MDLRINKLTLVVGMLMLAGCSSVPTKPMTPGDLANIPDAVPKIESRSRSGNPEYYDQSGKRYWVLSTPIGYVARGKASWYGGKFHGRRTSSGETYDMYAMTAAHKTLPIPCYARVTNLENGRSIVVKINDRGPFVDGRIVDLSYAAASKLGVVAKGTAAVELRVINPREPSPTQFAAVVPMAPAATPVVKVEKKKIKSVQVQQVSAPARPVSGVVIPAKPSVQVQPSVKTAAPVAAPKESVAKVQSVQPVSTPPPVKTVPVADQQPLKALPPVPSPALGGGVYLQLGAFSSAANASAEQAKLQGLQSNPVEVEKDADTLGTLYRVFVGPVGSESVALDVARQLQSKGFDQYRIIRR